MALTAEYLLTLGCNVPKGDKPWKRGLGNHHGPAAICFGVDGKKIIHTYACENMRTSAAIASSGLPVNDYWQARSGGGRCSATVLSNGRMWYLVQDHTLRSQLETDYEKDGVEAGVGYGKMVNVYHPHVFGLKHKNGAAITFSGSATGSYSPSSNYALIGVFGDANVEPGRHEMYPMDVWGSVAKGQDMDLAGRGLTLAMSYRGYVFRDKGNNGNYTNSVTNPDSSITTTSTPWEHRRVNYIRFLHPDTGNALRLDGTEDTTNRFKIDMIGTFGTETYSGDVKGICIDTDFSAVVCVGNDLVKVTKAGVRKKIATSMALPDPWRICRSGDFYFVFCWGDQRVYKVRASDGHTVAFGRSGGRQWGPYVPTDYARVSDITEDGLGGYWVCELEAPRRIANFNASGAPVPVVLNGVTWPEIYCGGPWVVPVTANPADTREVLFGSTLNGRSLLKINFRNLTYKVVANFDGSVGRGREFWSGGECEHIWIRQEGRDYFMLRTTGLIVVYRLNRTLMQLRVAAKINLGSGWAETATDEAGTTFTRQTVAAKAISSRIFAGPADKTLDIYAMSHAGPLKKLPVSSFNAHGNPVYDFNQVVNCWEWNQMTPSLTQAPGLVTGDPVPPDQTKLGVSQRPTGFLAVSSDRIIQMHSTQNGLQASYNSDNSLSTSSWGLSHSNQIFRWNRQTKVYLGNGGKTHEIYKTASNYTQVVVNSWTPDDQLPADSTQVGLPPVDTFYTLKCMLPRAIRDKYFIFNGLMGGGSKDRPCLKHMVDKDGKFYRGPYENRVISARSPYHWYYTEGTENGAGDILEDMYTGHVLLYASHECEAVVHKISGPEFGVGPTISLPPDDDTPSNAPPTVFVDVDKTSGAPGTPFLITANASDPDGSIVKVEYFVGSVLLGQTTQAPHQWTWTPATAGGYAIKAVAHDNLSLSSSSNIVSVQVTGAAEPPTISISAPTTAKVGTAISITATAGTSSGTISKVEFFVNNTEIFEDAASPYAASYTFTSEGTYELSAQATNSQNLTGFSTRITIVVGPADVLYETLPVPITIDSGASGDINVDGGSTPPWIFVDQVIDVSAEDTREQTFYRTERSGPHTYTFPGLDPAKYYEVKLHFCENYFATTGKRRFNVAINDNPEWSLNDFDIVANAGARFKALVKKFVVTGASTYVIRYTAGSADTPSNSGIEIVATTGPDTDPPLPPSGRKKIKIAADVDFQTAAGPGILENVKIPALSAEFAAAIEDAQQEVVAALRAGVDPAGDTLAKLYALVKSLSDILNTLGGSTVQFTDLETVRTDGRRWRAKLGTGETPQLVWTEILATTTPPTAPVTDDVADTFNWTNTPNITTLADYEYTTNGGVSYQTVTAKPLPVGNINAAAGQVGVRVKATSGRAASSTLYNTVAFTGIIVLAPSNLIVS